MPTLTTNFGFSKPLVNNPIDENLWGDQLNANWDSNDSILKTARDFIKRDVNFAASPYSVVSADRNRILLVDATAGNVVIDLIAAATAGDGYTIIIKKTDSSSNTVTIDGNLSETIDGAATLVISAENDTKVLICDGANWRIARDVAVVPNASESVAGITEYATDAEAQAQTATDKALVASNLAAIEATQADMEAETANRFVPADLLVKGPGVAKAWITFKGTGTVSIFADYNITSLADDGTGLYTVNFDNNMSSVNYVAIANCRPHDGAGGALAAAGAITKAASSVTIETRIVNSSTTATRFDIGDVNVAIWGDT